MDTPQQQAILTLCLLAAFADGANDREREEIRRIAESLAGESGNALLSAPLPGCAAQAGRPR
jgi:hypothetical protein